MSNSDLDYSIGDSIKAERLLIDTGIVEKCQHKHKFSDVINLECGEKDFCFVCFKSIE